MSVACLLDEDCMNQSQQFEWEAEGVSTPPLERTSTLKITPIRNHINDTPYFAGLHKMCEISTGGERTRPREKTHAQRPSREIKTSSVWRVVSYSGMRLSGATSFGAAGTRD